MKSTKKFTAAAAALLIGCTSLFTVAAQDTVPTQTSSNQPQQIYDADKDGKFDVKDVTAVQKYAAGYRSITVDLEAADANGDGTINVNDATVIQKVLASMGVEPPTDSIIITETENIDDILEQLS